MTGMFKNFYPEADFSLAQEFAKKVFATSQRLSSAQIQGFFMLFKNEPRKALEKTELLKKE